MPLRSPDEFIFPKSSDVVTINVGGRDFRTTLSTLRSQPGSLLAEKFADEPLKKAGTEPLFVDRNPDAFEAVLEFLRTGKRIPSLKPVSPAAIDEEFRFWRLAPSYVDTLTPSPAYTLADQTRQRTVAAMLREGTIYVEAFMRIVRQELDVAAQNAKSELYLCLGAPPAPLKGKQLHDVNLHKWLSLRRGHLSLLSEALLKEGFVVNIQSGLPEKDWVWIQIQWPLVLNEPIKGSFTFE